MACSNHLRSTVQQPSLQHATTQVTSNASNKDSTRLTTRPPHSSCARNRQLAPKQCSESQRVTKSTASCCSVIIHRCCTPPAKKGAAHTCRCADKMHTFPCHCSGPACLAEHVVINTRCNCGCGDKLLGVCCIQQLK